MTHAPAATADEAALPAVARSADQKFCHACSHLLHQSAPSCPHCGALQPSLPAWAGAQVPGHGAPAALARDHVFCRGCGRPIHETALACPGCGAPQRVAGAARGPSRNAAAALALLLGGFGAHKFYLGKVFQGLLYLLFFWTFIPAVIAFVEGVYYLTLPEQEFSDKYR